MGFAALFAQWRNGGKDFTVICLCFATAAYRFGALIVDALCISSRSRVPVRSSLAFCG